MGKTNNKRGIIVLFKPGAQDILMKRALALLALCPESPKKLL